MLHKQFVIISVIFFTITNGQILEFPDYFDHPCKRECKVNETKFCYYKLTLEYMFTNEAVCLNCLSGSEFDCYNSNCLVADGGNQLTNVYNRYLPGPAIEVCQGDVIIADVVNSLKVGSTTIHWHGMHQFETPYMDGVPFVTQCPVLRKNTFRYNFEATEVGTHWYHSHEPFQREKGAFAALIVRQPKELNPHRNLYDVDMTSTIITLTDWFKEDALTAVLRYYRMKIFYSQLVSAILVNGFGYRPGKNTVPMKRFYVQKGKRYRFRVIHAGTSVCPIEMTISGHKLTVISGDGVDIKPVTVDKLIITNGERIDFVLDANQVVAQYAMYFVGGIACNNILTEAILEYVGAPSQAVIKIPRPQPTDITFNCVNENVNKPNCINYKDIETVVPMKRLYTGKPALTYYIELDMLNYAEPQYRGIGDAVLFTAAFNRIIGTTPKSPLLQTTKGVNSCNKENSTCKISICDCDHIIELPEKVLVEFFMVDKGKLSLLHPMHIHGYNFAVVAQNRISTNTTIEEVRNLDRQGLIKRNFNSPPVKDTVPVPSGGYVVLRFYTYNPGYWFVHCHVDFHMDEGMNLIFKVGKPKKLPKNFPRCGNYLCLNQHYQELIDD